MVFISHSSKDKQVAQAICHYLESENIPCWIAPRDIAPGELYASAIISALDRVEHFVLLFSEHSLASRHVLKELERAASRNLIIIPFRIDITRPTGAYEYFMSECHWLDAMSPPLEAHIEKLVETVKAVQRVTATVRPHVESAAERKRAINELQLTAPDEWCSSKPTFFSRIITKLTQEYDF